MAESTNTTEPVVRESISWMNASYWISQPWLQHTIAALVALCIAVVIWRILHRGIGLLCRKNAWLRDIELLVNRVARWVYWMVAALFILQQAGVDTSNLWTAITAALAMVAIGFIAVWSILSNVVASILILANKLFKVDQDVEVMEAPGGSSVRGKVRSIEIMFTVIEEKHEDGGVSLVKVPNNVFFQKLTRVRSAK